MFCNVKTLTGFYMDTESVGSQKRKIHLQG